MRIILDTDKKKIIVPWNYSDKLKELNRIIEEGGGNKHYSFTSYIQEAWDFCMQDTDKYLVVAEKPARKK